MQNESDIDLIERERVSKLTRDGAVFVFGSNLKGVHGAGAARFAQRHFGAKTGIGEGMQGQSYAIPTKVTWRDEGMPIAQLQSHVEKFIEYARLHPDVVFAVTRIGCGYAGYSDEDIAPLFCDAPENCKLPQWWTYGR